MDRLPPELIALIVSFLNEDDNDDDDKKNTTTNLAAYAPISRQYQVAVEHLTFRRLRVQSGAEHELALFAERLRPRHRRAALAELAFEVLLPAYSADRSAKFERRREREANNAAFSAAVAALFGVLRGWEEEDDDDGKAGRGIALHLGAYAVADVERPRALDEWRDLGAYRYGKSVLRLSDGDGDGDGEMMHCIPEVRRIVEFRTPGRSRCTRRLRAASVARIAAAGMPNLARVEWELDDCAFAEDEVRHRCRKDLADALSAVANGRLTDFSLRLRLDDPQNDAFSVPSGTDPADPAGVDALSVALHDWLSAAPKLVSFSLSMSLSPSIFGPDAALSPSSSSSSSSPSSSPSSPSSQPPPIKYPHLRTAHITTGRTTAAGTWLYSADAQAQAAAADLDWEAAADDPYDRESGYSSSACMTSWSSEELVDPDDSDWAETHHAWHDALATGRRPRRRFRTRVERGLLEGFVGGASRAVMVTKGKGKGDMPRLERLVVQVGEEVGEGLWCWRFDDLGEAAPAPERQIYWECGVDRLGGDGGGMEERKRKVVRVVTLPGAWNEDPRWKPSKELREMWERWVGEEGKVEVSLCEDYF